MGNREELIEELVLEHMYGNCIGHFTVASNNLVKAVPENKFKEVTEEIVTHILDKFNIDEVVNEVDQLIYGIEGAYILRKSDLLRNTRRIKTLLTGK
jgi:hypothetical protein